MANFVFFFEGKLSHCLSIFWKNKKGIVSKPPLPFFFEADASLTGTLDDRSLPSGETTASEADEPRSPF